jgi:hypothetical protein
MGSIHPMSPRDPLSTGSRRAEGSSPSETTAAKVSQIKLPIIEGKPGLGGRKISLLEDVNQLSKKIRGDWNLLAPEELAEKIIELEDKVSLLKGTSPEIAKIKRQTERLHFRFVFPLDADFQIFTREIQKGANQIFKTHSLAAFHNLNSVQQREVMRIAGRKS